MDKLVGQLAAKAGIDDVVAEKTLGIVLGSLRSEVPTDKVQALTDAIPSAEAAFSASGRSWALQADGRRPDGRRLPPLMVPRLGVSEIWRQRDLASARFRTSRVNS